MKLRQEPSSEEVIAELQNVINRKNWDEVVFCGFGEPLERLDCVVDVTKWTKKYFGKTVRIDTNGQGFLLNKERDVIEELKKSWGGQNKRKSKRSQQAHLQSSL